MCNLTEIFILKSLIIHGFCLQFSQINELELPLTNDHLVTLIYDPSVSVINDP